MTIRWTLLLALLGIVAACDGAGDDDGGGGAGSGSATGSGDGTGGQKGCVRDHHCDHGVCSCDSPGKEGLPCEEATCSETCESCPG